MEWNLTEIKLWSAKDLLTVNVYGKGCLSLHIIEKEYIEISNVKILFGKLKLKYSSKVLFVSEAKK